MDPRHEASDYAAAHAIPTIHEDTSGQDVGEDIEVRRLRFDLAAIRDSLTRLAGEHPDGTGGTAQNVQRRSNARDPGHVIGELEFVARTHGLTHPLVAARLAQVAAWEVRLPEDFEAVREEYLADHAARLSRPLQMFRKWSES